MTVYGYIGLGNMGAAMAGRLVESGHDVRVYDVDAERVATVVAAGATAASSAAEVGAVADVVSICVPAAHHITSVLTGSGGLAESARPGQTILVHSTVAPETMIAAAADAATFGARLFDACIAGGVESARIGELVVLCGDLGDLPPEAAAALAIYGSQVIDAGPLGSGAALKLAFNVMTYAQFAAAAAAFDIVKTAGGDTAALVDAWRHVGQLSRLTENFLPVLSIPPQHMVGRVRDSMHATVALADKDLDLAHAALGSPSAKHLLLDAVRASMPETFGVATPPEEPSR